MRNPGRNEIPAWNKGTMEKGEQLGSIGKSGSKGEEQDFSWYTPSFFLLVYEKRTTLSKN